MGAGREFEGKDLDEALRAASQAFGSRPGEIEYELLTEGRRGVFGIGARNVRIWVNLPGEAPSAPLAIERSFLLAESTEASVWAEDTLRRLIDAMGFDLGVKATTAEEGVRIEIRGPDARHVVTNDGELLEALQFLLNRMLRQVFPDGGRIQLECEGYRERRDRDLVERARDAAQDVSRTGVPRWFEGMNAYERRLVHIVVREFPGLTSCSEGAGALKRLKIELAETKGKA